MDFAFFTFLQVSHKLSISTFTTSLSHSALHAGNEASQLKSWGVSDWIVCLLFRWDPSFSCSHRDWVIFWSALTQVPIRARLFRGRFRLTREACLRWPDPRPLYLRRSQCQSRERRTKKKKEKFFSVTDKEI